MAREDTADSDMRVTQFMHIVFFTNIWSRLFQQNWNWTINVAIPCV